MSLHRAYAPGIIGGTPAEISLILGAGHDFNTAVAEWVATSVPITSAANMIIVGVSWEQNAAISSVLIRNAADTTTLATLASIGAGRVFGASNVSNTQFFGVFNAGGLGIDAADTRLEVAFDGTASGSAFIWRFQDATRLPTTGDFDSDDGGGLGVEAVSGSITISAGEESGILCGAVCTNATPDVTGTGGQTQRHENTAAGGGQANFFSDERGGLAGTETPGASWTGANRASGQWVLAA